MAVQNLAQAGDVQIKAITLSQLSGGKSVSIAPQVVGFSIYESIINPVITAELMVYDAVDLLYSFPIIGEEKVSIEFATAGYDDTVTYDFIVNSVEHITTLSYNRGKSYVIRLASEEVLKNAGTQVNKKYSMEASAIVQQILQSNLNSQKSLVIDTTKGIQDVLVSTLRPFQAIDMIRRRAISSKYESASYCFFENQDGFSFCTIEKMMDDGKGRIGDKQFVFDASGRVDFTASTFRNVLGFRNVSAFNNGMKIGHGSLRNVVRKFDLLTGAVTKVTYDNLQDQGKFKFATDDAIGLNTSDFEGKYGDDTSTNLMIPASADLPENYMGDYAGKRQAFAGKISQNLYHAHVYGDSKMKAGDVITIAVPTTLGTTDKQDQARLTSGNYLVAKLRHIVGSSASAGRRVYTQSLELVKGTYEDNS